PEVDCFIGTDGFQDILLHLAAMGDNSGRLALKSPPTFIMDSATPRRLSTPSHRAFLKITEGCINRCTYCMIPSIRGTLRSREMDDIVREARQLQAQGVKELCLIAQDLTAYGLDRAPKEPQLVALLEMLLSQTTIPWLRLLYLHPQRVSQPLLDLMAANPRLLPYLDIPVQHVSDRILKLMNRPYGRKYLEELFARIRRTLPDIALRTTLMVGFPGETEAEVEAMESFLREQQLDHVGIFTYSNEEGCAAANLPDHCPEEQMEERREHLMAVQAEISAAKNRQRIGQELEVLVEGLSSETDLLLEGRSRYQAPEVDGAVYIADGVCAPGDLVKVRITEAHTYDLVGEVV
ncbi:MAG: 30S ribosomal protein S12 methylthiotransferase RimO, partial [Desulfobulbaceae bacterium]|nr:30S ribosomal protein S12 methylthiotransferase RimO [Desulfobulbaceae bacterium]